MADTFQKRTFYGDPNPAPAADALSVPAGTALPLPAPTSAPSGALPLPAAELPVVSGGEPIAAPAEQVYWVRNDEGDARKIFFGVPGGDAAEVGTVIGPNTDDLVKRFGRQNAFGNYEISPELAESMRTGGIGFSQRIANQYQAGEASVIRGLWGARWLRGEVKLDKATEHGNIERQKMLKNERPDIAWGEAPFSRLLGEATWVAGEAANIIPFMKGAALESAGGAAALGGAALGAMAATGTIVTPAAVPLVSGAMSTGAAYGAFKYTMNVEGGNIALDMAEKGFSEDTIKKVAPVAGALIGGMELVGFRFLTAPAKRAAMKTIFGSDAVQKAMSHWVANYSKELGAEVSVEAAQELVSQMGNNFGAMLEERPELANTKEDIWKALTETAAKAAVGMAVVKLPGAAMDYAGSRRTKAAASRVALQEEVKNLTVEQIEKGIAPEMEDKIAAQIKDALKAADKSAAVERAASKIAASPRLKEALHTRGEALMVKKDAILEGKDFAELADAEQKEVLIISQEIENLNTVAAAVEKVPPPVAPTKEAPKTAAESVERQYTEGEAALRTLEKDTAALETELGLLGREVEARAAEGKPTTALTAKLEKLAAQINENTRRAADIIAAPLGDTFTTEGLEATIPVERLIKMERDLSAGVQKAKEVAHKHGEAFAKREVKKVQTYLRAVVEQAALTESDRDNFFNAIKNVQTVEQLEKAMPEFQARLKAAEETRRAKVMDNVLKKGLKKGKAKTTNGKMTGKFGDPATQAIVDSVTKVIKMTKAQAEQELVVAEKELMDAAANMGGEGYTPEAHALAEYRFRAAMYRAGQLLGKESAEFIADVTAMMAGAKAKFLEKRIAEKAALDAKRAAIAAEILGGKELPPDWTKREMESGELATGVRAPRGALGINIAAILDLQSWARLMARLSGKKAGTSVVETVFSTVEAAIKAKGIKARWEEKLAAAAEKAYNITGKWYQKAWKLRKLDDRLTERHYLGEYKDAGGVTYALDFSVDEAIKRWMEKQDPTLMENFSDPKALAYTPQMEEAIFGLMLPEDRAFGSAQLELYRAFYKEMNGVYSRIHGINLPFNPFYSPIKVLGYEQKEKETVEHDGSADRVHPKSTAPGSTIRRQKHRHPLAQMSSRSAFTNHIFAASHYIAFEEKVRMWNAVLSDKAVRAAIVGMYGSEALHSATAMVETITANQFGRAIMRGMDRLITRLVVAKILAKPIGAVKQMTTMLAFAEPVPVEEQHLWYAEFGQLLATQKLPSAWMESDFVVSRQFDQTPELSAREEYEKRVRGGRVRAKTKMGRAGQYIANALHHPSIVDKLGIFLQLGDRASIVYAGGALFNYYKSKGMSDAEAVARTSEVAATTQSYGHVSSLSLLQQQKGAWRMLTFFTNQPVQHMRKVVGALADMTAKGRITKKDAIKTIIYYQFIMPMLFQAVVDWGWDEENQLRAAIFGPFNAYPAVGEALWNLYEKYFYEDGTPMGNRTMWAGMIKDVEKAFDELMRAEDLADYARAMALLSDPVMSATFGVPTKPLLNLAEAGEAVSEDEYERAAKLAAGYSPYMVNEQEEGD